MSQQFQLLKADALDPITADLKAAVKGDADRAVNAVNDIVSEKEVPISATRHGMESIEFPAGMIVLKTLGYGGIEDGGGAYHRRVDSEPGHPGKVRSLDRFTASGGNVEDQENGGWWELSPYQNHYPEMFGAKGDGRRPSDSFGEPSGTDDTAAFKDACQYLQDIAFQPNFFVGKWGGSTLHLRDRTAYVLKGDNPLGTTRDRNTEVGDAGQLQRQNWHIEGNDALILWTPSAKDDALIQSYETLVRQTYRKFSVILCGISETTGWLYRNTAADGRNATTHHIFDSVLVNTVGPGIQTNQLGLEGIFYYTGTNLGDRLQTHNCQFGNFRTGFYSENLEAVSQEFHKTTFNTYIDDATFFHIRRHGSDFSTLQCTFLAKGHRNTLFKTEFLLGNDTSHNGSTSLFRISHSRLETSAGRKFTLADVEFGNITIEDVINTAGGLPDPESVSIRVSKLATVTVRKSHLYGRFVVGSHDGNFAIRRTRAMQLDDCMFSMDVSANIFVERDDGTLVSYRDNVGESEVRRAVVVTNTNTPHISWQGISDSRLYLHDGVYLGTEWPNLAMGRNTVFVGRRRSNDFWYLGNEDYFILPMGCVIESIKLTHISVDAAVADQVKLKVGDVERVVDLGIGKVSQEIMNNRKIIVSDTDIAQRTLSIQTLKDGAQGGDFVVGFLEISYRQAFGRPEFTLNENSEGVRLTRLV